MILTGSRVIPDNGPENGTSILYDKFLQTRKKIARVAFFKNYLQT